MRLPTLAVSALLILGCGHLTQTVWGRPARPPDKPPASIYVTGAALSADAKRLVVGYGLRGGDGRSEPIRDGKVTLALWDVETGKNLWATGTPEDLVPVGFRADGREIVVCILSGFHDNGGLQVWDADTGRPLRTVTPDRQPMTCAALSPDGTTAISGDYHGCLRVWDVVDSRLLRSIGGPQMSACTILFSPDGRLVLSGHGWLHGPANLANVWEFQTGRLLLSVPSYGLPWGQVAVSPGGTLSARPAFDSEGGRNIPVLSDVATAREVRRLDVQGDAAASTTDGKQLAVANCPDGRVTVLDRATGQRVWTIDRKHWQGSLAGPVPIEWDGLVVSDVPTGKFGLWMRSANPSDDRTGIKLAVGKSNTGQPRRILDPLPPRPKARPQPPTTSGSQAVFVIFLGIAIILIATWLYKEHAHWAELNRAVRGLMDDAESERSDPAE